MIIRPAIQSDAAQIAEIWNVYIRGTTVTFTTEEKSPADVTAYIETRQSGGMTVVVAEHGGVLVGFAAASVFRSGPGYDHTRETSVMLADGLSGRGTGRALMMAVEAHARDAKISALVAGISGENAAAVAFHARLGFQQVGLMPGVGRKFGRKLDLVLMQKTL
ncbi:MAG: N-acetyltransferase family protein [Pseudomonadota bacterium]